MALQEEAQVQATETHSSPLEVFLCEELSCEEDVGDRENAETLRKNHLFLLFPEENELQSLISKEEQTHLPFPLIISDEHLMESRKEALTWIFRVGDHFSFSSLTYFLAVNYYDRFISNVRFQNEKPWMSHLAAVACLSLAAKVEETEVPLLLDLQVVESEFIFEAKTIQRMELLVLSALQWKMHPITPISFFHHITRKLPLENYILWDLLGTFQSLLLSVIADQRFLCYLPSVIATATLLHIINGIEPFNFLKYQNLLLKILEINENHLHECYQFILDSLGSQGNKSKQMTGPGSPNGVINRFFISDSSNDSWPNPPKLSLV